MVPEIVQTIITIAFLAIGYVLKNKTTLNNKWIPVALVVIAAGKNLIAQLTGTPEIAPMLSYFDAHIPVLYQAGGVAEFAQASFWSGIMPIISIIIPSIVEAVIPVGWHSFLKNTFQALGQREMKKVRAATRK